MTGDEEQPAAASRWERTVRAIRETRRGRVGFVLAFCVLGWWLYDLVLGIRNVLLSGRDTRDLELVLDPDFDYHETLELTSRAAFHVSRDWWAIGTSVLIVVLLLLAVRFLDRLRGRPAWRELGLRGGVARPWTWIVWLPLLPALSWIAWRLLGTEPEPIAVPFTWGEYLFPFSREGSNPIVSIIGLHDSARPVWWLRSGISALVGSMFLYGFAWRQLRRTGLRFWTTAGLGIAFITTLSAVDLSIRASVPDDSPWEMIGSELFFTAVFALEFILSGWIVDRWGGRVWPLAIAAIASQLPNLCLDLRYADELIAQRWISGPSDLLRLSAWDTLPLVFLALLTLLGPRLGLPSLPRDAVAYSPARGDGSTT